jgi:uncharacterized tellurite resistance protein B-like protein
MKKGFTRGMKTRQIANGFVQATDRRSIERLMREMCCIPSVEWQPIVNRYIYEANPAYYLKTKKSSSDKIKAEVAQEYRDDLISALFQGIADSDGTVESAWTPPRYENISDAGHESTNR